MVMALYSLLEYFLFIWKQIWVGCAALFGRRRPGIEGQKRL